jgi:hypothetical protein
MEGFDSSDMILYTYLDERWTVHHWKKVASNITARMVLNSYILYKENYRRPGKLKSRYNYTMSIIESLGEESLALKDNATEDDPHGPRGLKNSLKRKSTNALSAAQRRGGREPEHYTPDATLGPHGECFPKHRC